MSLDTVRVLGLNRTVTNVNVNEKPILVLCMIFPMMYVFDFGHVRRQMNYCLFVDKIDLDCLWS